MPHVNYIRQELKDAKKRYNVIKDCLGGEISVKAKGTTYLPMPNATDESEENSTRYAAYKTRATFYNVTKRTLDGLCGQIFIREPVIEVPDSMNNIVKDADGGGVSLTQMAKAAADDTLGYGRAGLFIDYPAVEGGATKEQLDKGDIRPTFTLYHPWEVINWRTITRGARELLSLVVLEEEYIEQDDGFEAKTKKQWRVLRLVNNVYTVEIWRQEGVANFRAAETSIPTDADGNPFDEIPFTFIGARNNDHIVDEAPMYDIASLNIAHYRNSADYEESAFMVGQPTPVFIGLSEDWVKNVLKGKVMLGARGSVSLPSGGDAKLLQANPNTMPYEAMQHKEKQMVALGARLVEQRSVVRTASEANIDHTTESSVLASTAKNVSAALTWGLEWAAKFLGVADEKISLSLNTDFDIAAMTPEERRQLVEEWQSGAISWEELRTNLRKSGIASMDDADAREKIDEELASLPVNTQNTGNDNDDED